MIKQLILSLLVLCLAIVSCSEAATEKAPPPAENAGPVPQVITPTKEGATDTIKKSIPAIAQTQVNSNLVTIEYHSPAVKGRVIWGGLVTYGQVWVTGAHRATSIEFKEGVKIAGRKVAAGKYALFTIPSEGEWTFILNKNWKQHLADEYNQSEDVLRMPIQPMPANHQERLMYTIDQTGERRFNIEMRWEKVEIKVPVEF
jgi:hypothetical protein